MQSVSHTNSCPYYIVNDDWKKVTVCVCVSVCVSVCVCMCMCVLLTLMLVTLAVTYRSCTV